MSANDSQDEVRALAIRDGTDFLKLPTEELLDAYGAGNAVPGSGSAAVLSALLAIEMMRTVCKLTLKKDGYQSHWSRLEFIQSDLEENYRPLLLGLFNRDIEAFKKVYTAREQRQRAENQGQKNHWERVQLDHLKVATDIPLELAEICMQLLPTAFYLYDECYKAVRGDSGVAVSNLQSAISGALFIVLLNLRSPFQPSRWLTNTRTRADRLAERSLELQARASERILNLYRDSTTGASQLMFTFAEDRDDGADPETAEPSNDQAELFELESLTDEL